MLLLLYRPMTPCCLVAAWGLLLGDPRSGPGDDGDGGDDGKHPMKCILWRAAMLATFA